MKAFLPLVFLLISTSIFTQNLIYEVSLDDRIDGADLIIEGRVVSQHSFWNAGHNLIFTANKIEVYKTLKGASPSILK